MTARVLRFGVPLALALAGGCTGSQAPRKGQVMVALATDMSVPKDISVIRVKAKLGAEVRYEYDFRIAPDGQFHLPGTIAVVEGSTPAPVVTVEVIGIRVKGAGKYEPRTFAKAITTIPRERTVLLSMPVQWLCDDSAVDDGTGEYLSTCSVDQKTGDETACLAGTCQPVRIDASKLPTYDPRDVFGGGTSPTDPNAHCFDTVTCFDGGFDLTAAELESNGGCSATFGKADGPLNFALVTSSDGICHGHDQTPPCYVPLDQDAQSGWHFADPTKGPVVFPAAVCEALDSGRADAVRVTTSCQTKTSTYATCGTWSTVSEPLPPPTDASGGAGGRGGAGGTGTGGASGAGAMDQGGAGADTAGTGDMGGQPPSAGGAGGSAGKGSAGSQSAGGTSGTTGGTGTGARGGTAGTGSDPTGGTAGEAGNGPPPASGGTGASLCPTVTFTDSALESIVREAIAKPTGTLTGSDVAGLTTLNANGNAIATLDGLECFTGLKTLNLSNNQITDLAPLGGLPGLQTLNLSNNLIASTAPLSALAGLSVVDLSNNQVTNFSGLTSLTAEIILAHNNLTDISALASLQTDALFIGDNAITDVSPLAGLTQLQLLDLSRNPGLSDLSPLAGLTNLVTFGFRTTAVTNIGAVAGMTKLIDLEFADCAVTSFTPLSGLTQMQQLYISNTGINDLTPLANMTKLTLLEAGAGNITDLSPLAGLPLQNLQLYTNSITDLTPLAGITTLVSLDLGNNLFSDITALAGLTNLSFLNLSFTFTGSLQPLIDNPGIGTGDFLNIDSTSLCSGQDSSDVATLVGRGVNVSFNSPAC